ncbi:MAG: hypothetical protein WA188_19560 [Terriglobales bacterium]
MEKIEFSDIIAERQLVGRQGDQTFAVTVRIGRPVPHPDGDWECPYVISGLPNPHGLRVGGVDAVQALSLALRAIGADLQLQRKDIHLQWSGMDDLGFPVPEVDAPK